MPVEPAAVGSPADSSGTKICVHNKALLLTLQLRNDFCNAAQQRWHRDMPRQEAAVVTRLPRRLLQTRVRICTYACWLFLMLRASFEDLQAL